MFDVYKLIDENKKTKAKRLDLRNCAHIGLPQELFKCIWLEELILSSIFDFKEPVIKEPEVSSKTIFILPSGFSNLLNLKQLYLSGMQYRDLSPISDLVNLEVLSISNSLVKDLTPLKTLTSLKQLNAHATLVSDISCLSELQNLEKLSISQNSIENIDPLKHLKKLEWLDIAHTKTKSLSPLSHLIEMEVLYAANTNIKDLKPISNLKNIKQLDVSDNEISDLNPLKNFYDLETLNISNTKVKTLLPLKKAVKIKKIDACNALINNLWPIQSLIDNSIPVFFNEPNSSYDQIGIFIKNNPLDQSLIAAIKQSREAVIKYFRKPKDRLWEARVLLLGEPRSGKTTLRRKLKSSNADLPTEEDSTRGIEIEVQTYKCEILKDNEKFIMHYHVWDFGGQEMYRLLHQLFISEQSVYVIVTDTDRNKNEEELDFWLETIQRLGRDKYDRFGPVILFQNAKTNREGNTFSSLKKRYSDLWRQSEDFSINLKKISTKHAEFEKQELNKFLNFKYFLENSFQHLDHVGQEMPMQWLNIRNAIAKSANQNWVTLENFREICKKNSIDDPIEQEDLLSIFHILGFVLHYKTGLLNGMVILNKKWATDALYRVLDDEIVRQNKGWFYKEDSKSIWYDLKYKDRQNELLQLMQEFKLCYYNQASRKYIVPSKLPEEVDSFPEWNFENNFQLQLHYDWLPRPIATQLIVLMHDYIVQLSGIEQWIWRKGAVLNGTNLEINDSMAMIIDNWKEHRIEIYARGSSSEVLIRTIMRNWRIVNEPYEDKVRVDKIILCSCIKCKNLEKKFEFSYDDVLEAREANETLKCNKSRVEINSIDILRGIFDEPTILADTLISKGNRSKLLRFIKDDELESALEKLAENDIVISLKGDLSRLNREKQKGIISTADHRFERGKISCRLIEYLKIERFFKQSIETNSDYFE